MKKKICALLLAGLLLLTASGCGSVFEHDYYYETDATGEFGAVSGNATEIRNYSMLKTALTNMISRHEEKGEFRMSSYNGSPSEDLAAACFEIKSDNPLGAYAVEYMSYDTSYVVSYYMATVYVSYKRTAEEMGSIVHAGSAAELDDCVRQALTDHKDDAAVRLYSGTMDEAHIHSLVRSYFYNDPVSLVLEPHATVTTYPAEGPNRIYEVALDYGVPQSTNTVMSLALSSRLRMALQAMQETEPLYLALESALYLSTLQESEGATVYPDTAYGALVEHTGSDKGLALAYKALCDKLDLPCIVVQGHVRNNRMQPHYWNIITIGDAAYHVDVSAFRQEGPADNFLQNDEAFWSRFFWETEEYPVCAGELTYADAARLEPEPTGETPPQTESETPEPSAEEPTEPSEEEPPEEGEKTS